MKKATRRLMLTLTNIVVLCSVMFVGVLAALEPAVSFSVNVSYEQAIKTKAYISTNAIDAAAVNFVQASGVTAEDFAIEKSALFLDTIVEPETYADLATFEAINSDEDGGRLKFGAEGIKFYIYFENYSADRELYCSVTVTIMDEESNFDLPTPLPLTATAEEVGEGILTKSLIVINIDPDEDSTAPELINKIQINVSFTSGPVVSGD